MFTSNQNLIKLFGDAVARIHSTVQYYRVGGLEYLDEEQLEELSLLIRDAKDYIAELQFLTMMAIDPDEE